MEYVVDVQGFYSLNGFVVKEMAIIPLEEEIIPKVYHFKPPCKWSCLLPEHQSCNKWLEVNFHGIPWSSGDIPFGRYPIVLHEQLKGCRKVFVKGAAKKQWLEQFLDNGVVLDLDDLQCPSLQKLRGGGPPPPRSPFCTAHFLKRRPICAMQNVDLLKDWLLNSFLKSRRVPTSRTTIAGAHDEVDEDGDSTMSGCPGDCVTMDRPSKETSFNPLSKSFLDSDEYKKQVLYSMYT